MVNDNMNGSKKSKNLVSQHCPQNTVGNIFYDTLYNLNPHGDRRQHMPH